MNQYLPITYIHAREILDSRGNPTIEAEVTLTDRISGARYGGERCRTFRSLILSDHRHIHRTVNGRDQRASECRSQILKIHWFDFACKKIHIILVPPLNVY